VLCEEVVCKDVVCEDVVGCSSERKKLCVRKVCVVVGGSCV